MRILKRMKEVSILITILMVLCSAIIGGLISYVWVMANFYNMPENTTMLVVENVTFPLDNFTYFNLTVINPSNSVSDVNITAFRLNVESKNETYDIATTDPPLDSSLNRGTRQTYKCLKNWSAFTNATVTVEPIATDISTKSYRVKIPDARLSVTTNFDATESAEYFNLTIENVADYDVNLTISEVYVYGLEVNDTSPPLPYVLPTNETPLNLRCNLNWANVPFNVTVTVRTLEGYETSVVTEKLLTTYLSITDVKFYDTDTSHFGVTINSLNDSTTYATISQINMTLTNGTTSQVEIPELILPLYGRIPKNDSRTFRCIWNWTQYRDENITVSAITREGFHVHNLTVTTPARIVWKIANMEFDLEDTMHFSVNVNNSLVSLDQINVTKIMLNTNETPTDPSFAVLASGENATFKCYYNWTSLRGNNATLILQTQDGLIINQTVPIPGMRVDIVDYYFATGEIGDLYASALNTTIPTGMPSPRYFNITLKNAQNSLGNATIANVVLEEGNTTIEIDGGLAYPSLKPSGYNLTTGETKTFICFSDWTQYLSLEWQEIKATVFMTDGTGITKTLARAPKP